MKATSSVRAEADEPLSSDPVIEVYKRDVDMTLIREQHRRSIDERVARMLGALRLSEQLAAAGRRGRR